MKTWSILAVLFSLVAGALWLWFPRPPATPESQLVEPGYQVGDRLTSAPMPVDGNAGPREIGWDDLIPAGWITEELLAQLNLDELAEVEDSDPRAQAALQKILAEWERAPVVEELGGQTVRIPGFVVPLEGDGKSIREFLLVPYFGACVHTPPPPSNQLIHVLPMQSIPGDWDMTPVWVVGELSITRFDSSLGSAGYQLRARLVEQYDESRSE